MQTQSKLWYFENFSMLGVLSMKEMIALDKKAEMRSAPKNEVIYFPEDASNSVYMLKAGKVKISKMSLDGKEIILAILGPGEVFGEMSITGQEKREEIAEATDDTIICVVKIPDLQMMMESNSRFNMQITKLIGFRLKKIQNRFESLIFKTSDERVRSFIRELADEHGRKVQGNNNEMEIRLKLTHEEIAKLTATSRQTVTTVLNELEKQSIITYDRSRIFVKEYDKL
ncbi:MAG: Crp/Fnr family transcriptional regulator [Bacteroidota bacterium]|nr:Crp/Fnr family transcriptional regulator [Bacteroidota bacterium]